MEPYQKKLKSTKIKAEFVTVDGKRHKKEFSDLAAFLDWVEKEVGISCRLAPWEEVNE